jgi:hypothetical protein
MGGSVFDTALECPSASVARAESQITPPICWLVLMRAPATPAARAGTLATAMVVALACLPVSSLLKAGLDADEIMFLAQLVA